MSTSRVLVLGTSNRGKVGELAELLASLDLQLKSLADFPQAAEIDETGESFLANATLKSVGQAKALGHWVLAEDSGIVVDALNGAPGIHSARFAGPKATDEENNRKLLAELRDTQLSKRVAHYECQLVLADPSGSVRATAQGQFHGRIRFEPAGTAGFGYDPLFEVVEYHRTSAELGERVKSVISHRARALRALLPQLDELLAD